jgi:HSP20 family molecular chaperone IbpA
MSGTRDRKDQTRLDEPAKAPGSRGRVMWSPKSLGREEEAWLPPVDVYEKGEYLVVELELPGVNKQDIKVCVIGSQLIVEGVKSEVKHGPEATGKGVSYLQLERKLGRFYRRIELPVACNTSEAQAVYDKGILVIELKKIVNRRGDRRRIVVK